jgi:hypothetical protein
VSRHSLDARVCAKQLFASLSDEGLEPVSTAAYLERRQHPGIHGPLVEQQAREGPDIDREAPPDETCVIKHDHGTPDDETGT